MSRRNGRVMAVSVEADDVQRFLHVGELGNAGAAEETSSTSSELSSQAEQLLNVMEFFKTERKGRSKRQGTSDMGGRGFAAGRKPVQKKAAREIQDQFAPQEDKDLTDPDFIQY